MPLSVSEAERIVRDGAEALRRGEGAAAATLFAQVTDAGLANAQIWLLAAHACRAAGDVTGKEAALDGLLALEPRSLRGLLMKGDCRARAGDRRAATSFYTAAKKAAATGAPADLAADLARIDGWLADADRDFKAHIDRTLDAAGIGAGERSARFRQSLALLAGEKQVYLQQPSAFYFPELPQRQFFEREEFAWLAGIEAATDVVREELLAVLARGADGFRPYLVSSPDRPRTDFHGLVDNPDWSTFYLWEKGGPVAGNVALCPRTFALLQTAPMPFITVRAPSILFSRLAPGARIPAHSGALNTRLICHLPLVVPPGCGFRVGNEVREWEVGKALIFDDSIEHEAWNDSDEDRIILIFDVWRPEMTDAERRAVTAIFEAVDGYGGAPATTGPAA